MPAEGDLTSPNAAVPGSDDTEGKGGGMDLLTALDLRYYEVVQIQALNLDTALWMIQFWVSATFAIVVAFHYAGRDLSRSTSLLMQVLYIIVSLILLTTYIQSADSVLFWNNVLDQQAIKAGVVSKPLIESTQFWRSASTWSGGLLIGLGTIASVYYGIRVRRPGPS